MNQRRAVTPNVPAHVEEPQNISTPLEWPTMSLSRTSIRSDVNSVFTDAVLGRGHSIIVVKDSPRDGSFYMEGIKEDSTRVEAVSILEGTT